MDERLKKHQRPTPNLPLWLAVLWLIVMLVSFAFWGTILFAVVRLLFDDPAGESTPIWLRLVVTLITFLLGGLSWVVPPHVMGSIKEHYPPRQSTWLGDGLSNPLLHVSMPIGIVIGFIYGFLFPAHWLVVFPAMLWIMPLNLVIDARRAPTYHNLWPIELIGFAIINAPAVLAAWLGGVISRAFLVSG